MSGEKTKSTIERLASGEFTADPELDEFETSVLQSYISLFDGETGHVPNNREMAKVLDVSRNAIARARRRIAHKIDIIKPGF